jgi:hypothetical protein
VFSGFWYERLQKGSRTYQLRNDREASSMYSHVVLCSKFSMLPIRHPIKSRFACYELRLDVLDIISKTYRATKLLD